MNKIPEQYRSKTMEQAVAHLAEELAEALQAAAKGLRFGLTSVNPELPPAEQESNFIWLRREMVDVTRAYHAIDQLMVREGYIEQSELMDDLKVSQ